MPEKVPAKNIAPILVDVKKKGFNYGSSPKIELDLARVPQKPTHSKKPRAIFLGVTILVGVILVFTVGFLALNFGTISRGFAQRGQNIMSNFSASIAAFKSFQPSAAVQALSANSQELSSLNDFWGANQAQSLVGLLGRFIPAVKDAGSFIGQVTNLNVNFLKFSTDLADLQVNGFKYFQSNGPALIQRLTDVHDLTGQVIGQIEALKNTTANLEGVSSLFGRADDLLSKDYLKYSADLYAWNKFLTAVLNLLNSSTDRHILLLFQNPGEIRPGGGFDGSYADLTLKNGQLQKIDVRDIYDPDGQLDLKVVPPQPLQGITHDWGARDANWFFDFPTSAKTVLNFLEQSKIYSEQKVTFDAVVALNIKVLETFLQLTGPINLPDYHLTIDQNNFLNEIQREVEAGADRAKLGYPKHILQVLTPQILAKLNNLSEDETAQFMGSLKEHLAQKDIMFYAKDPDLASLLAANDLDGAVYDLPSTFWGNYLGVVNANVAGGKSDVFVDQNVTTNINIDTDGNILTDLMIQRTHTGNTEKDPWWRATNNDFLQVLTEPRAGLLSLTGNDNKRMPSAVGYTGYSVNADLAAIENTMTPIADGHAWSMAAFGKNVFAAWLLTPAGQSKTLDWRYQTAAPSQFVLNDGTPYEFIFDRQSGTLNETLNVAVSAPLGFVWAENDLPVFNYRDPDPAGRVILNLTLKKQ